MSDKGRSPAEWLSVKLSRVAVPSDVYIVYRALHEHRRQPLDRAYFANFYVASCVNNQPPVEWMARGSVKRFPLMLSTFDHGA